MKPFIALLTLSLFVPVFTGCHTDTSNAPSTEPRATSVQAPTNEHPDPNNRDCDAIKDPAQAEDCRLWKGIAAAKKKHNSDPVVKHSPGSIQQP